MNEELTNRLEKAETEKKANKKFLRNLSKVPNKKLDQKFHEAHEKAFEKTDCLECANCCKTTSPIFRDKDIERLAKHFKIKAVDFVSTHLHMDNDGDYVLNSAPCPFLFDDNQCGVYDWRPNACREYPHTDRKNMYQLLDLTYKNSLVCPAVAQMVEQMKVG
jgi:uncharacterized protein